VQNSSCTFCNKRLLGIELETKHYKVSLKRWVEGNSEGEHRVPLLQDRVPLLEFAALFVRYQTWTLRTNPATPITRPGDTVDSAYWRGIWRDTSPPAMGSTVALEKDEHSSGDPCQEENRCPHTRRTESAFTPIAFSVGLDRSSG
jgi:hypothetical protein